MPNKNETCPKCGNAVSKDSSFMLCLPCRKITTLEAENAALKAGYPIEQPLVDMPMDRQIVMLNRQITTLENTVRELREALGAVKYKGQIKLGDLRLAAKTLDEVK